MGGGDFSRSTFFKLSAGFARSSSTHASQQTNTGRPVTSTRGGIPIEPSASNRCRFDYTPTTMKSRFLYELAYRMCDEHVWSIILTPNYNAAHDNHYHVDLTPNYPRTYLGREGPTLLRTNPGQE